MESVKLFENELNDQVILDDLKHTMEGLVDHLFGKVEKRWVEASFPFTHPSLELEIFFNNDWLEVLGCGVIHDGVISYFLTFFKIL
jgi:phenylalanyl-tRNA synthetase alpha chain